MQYEYLSVFNVHSHRDAFVYLFVAPIGGPLLVPSTFIIFFIVPSEL